MSRSLRFAYWGLGLAVLIGMPTYAALTPRWTARTTLIPSGEPSPGISPSLLSLAASAGAGGFLNPATSLDLVRSLFLDEQVLQQVVHRPLADGSGITVAEAIGYGRASDGEGTAKAARRLRDRLNVNLDVSAQTLSVSVSTPDSVAAVPLLRGLVAVVDSIHRAAQARQAAELRGFMEQQVADARSRLDRSEDRLERFLVDNRTMATPSLQMQAARLERLVDLDRQWAQSLELQLAQALFSEAKDIPVLATAVPPTAPLLPDSDRVRTAVMLALLFLVSQVALGLIVLPRLSRELNLPTLTWLADALHPRKVG